MAEHGVLPVGVSDSVPKDGPAKGGVLAMIVSGGALRAVVGRARRPGWGGWDGAPRCEVTLRVTKKYLKEQSMFFDFIVLQT